jgi:hypothetical protein
MELPSFDQHRFAKGLQRLANPNNEERVIQSNEIPMTPPVIEEGPMVVLSEDKLREMLDEVARKAVDSVSLSGAVPPVAAMEDTHALTRLVMGMQMGAAMAPTQRLDTLPMPKVRKFGPGNIATLLLAGALGAGVILAGQYAADNNANAVAPAETAPPATHPSNVYLNSSIEQSSPNQALQEEGTSMMLEQATDGSFVAGGTKVSWQVLTVSPDGTRYSIQLSIPSPAGGYQPDASLQERFTDSDISDQELVRFLLANNIIAPSRTDMYVEIVGRSSTNEGDHPILKSLQLKA